MSRNQKLLLALALIALVVVVAGVMIYSAVDKSENSVQTKNRDKKVVNVENLPGEMVKTNLENDEIPDKFPTEIAIEEGATITQNFNVTTQDGRLQATRGFDSKKTAKENHDIYTNLLKTTGWEIDATLDTDTYKMVSGKKNGNNVQVSINQSLNDPNVSTVSISYTEVK